MNLKEQQRLLIKAGCNDKRILSLKSDHDYLDCEALGELYNVLSMATNPWRSVRFRAACNLAVKIGFYPVTNVTCELLAKIDSITCPLVHRIGESLHFYKINSTYFENLSNRILNYNQRINYPHTFCDMAKYKKDILAGNINGGYLWAEQ